MQKGFAAQRGFFVFNSAAETSQPAQFAVEVRSRKSLLPPKGQRFGQWRGPVMSVSVSISGAYQENPPSNLDPVTGARSDFFALLHLEPSRLASRTLQT